MSLTRGIVEYGAKHIEVLQDRGPGVRVVVGGYGSGKTTLGVGWVLDLGFRHGEHGPILGTEPTYRTIKDVMERTLIECLDKWSVPYKQWKSDHIFEIGKTKKFEFWCRSLDKPRSVEGINAIGLWADEWELCDPEALVPAMQRVRRGTALEILLTGTPEGYGPAFDLILDKPASSTRTYRISTRDNTMLPPSYYEDAKARLGSEEAILEKLEGIRTAKGGRVYSQFERSRHATKPCVLPGAGEIQIACDFNVQDMTWLICQVHDKTRCVHVLAEVVGPEAGTDTMAQIERIKKKLDEVYRSRGESMSAREMSAEKIKAFCDAAGAARTAVTPQTHVTLLSQAGFRPMHGAANPRIIDRVNDVQVMLRDNRLTIDPRQCPSLLKTLEQQPWDGNEPSKKAGLDHAADAIGYLIHWQFPTERPKANSPSERERRILDRNPATRRRGGLE